MNLKLKIMADAISIRLDKGETFNDIIKSYPSLTEEEIQELKKRFKDQ